MGPINKQPIIMQVLKYAILGMIILNLPEVIVRNFGSALGTISSYSVFLLLILYYLFLEKRGSVNKPLILLALSYYVISGFQSQWQLREFAFIAIKFFVVIICGYEVVKNTSVKEISYFFVIGSLTVILHPILFANNYGRYSGFYFNPNNAGFIAIIAFALTFSYEKGLMKTGKTLISSLGGLMTFSRTFVALWVLLNLISVKISIKNIRIFAYGIGVVLIIFSTKEVLQLNTKRINEFEALINNDKSGAKGLSEDSRADTWSLYYELIYQKPFFGNGYDYFQGGHLASAGVGVHNSFLMVLGEAGFIPFLIFVGYFIYLFIHSYLCFKQAPHLFMMTIGLAAVLMADHGFFYHLVFPITAMWIQYQIKVIKEQVLDENIINNPIIT